MRQPPIEVALGAPLQVRESDGECVVEIRDRNGRKVELKRFKHAP